MQLGRMGKAHTTLSAIHGCGAGAFLSRSIGRVLLYAGDRTGRDGLADGKEQLYSDDETFAHALDLSMVAGALIRAGDLPVPDRWDGLYKGNCNGNTV